jgi:putative lipoprotein
LALVIFDESLDKEIKMSSEQAKTISGKVYCPQEIELGPYSTLSVELLDVSLADAPAQIAVHVKPNADVAGLDFTLKYKASDVLPGHSYAISARIAHYTELAYMTTENHPVSLDGSCVQLQEVRVDPVCDMPFPRSKTSLPTD